MRPELENAQRPETPLSRDRDEDWYLEDGDVVLLVENQLFRVHKFLFTRSSPLFRTLFALPQGKDTSEDALEGQSDENPIICHGDQVVEFQALCWALYARPPDILAQEDWDTADIPRIFLVLTISHKYGFAVFEDWALRVLDILSSIRPEEFFGKLGTWDAVCRTIQLASQCSRDTLVQRMEQDWLSRISSLEERRTAFKYALDAAERSGDLRLFHGKVYYAYLQAIGMFISQAQDNPSATNDSPSDPLSGLSQQRQQHIHRGFWSLWQLRLKLSCPPKLDATSLCPANYNHDCALQWQTLWEGISNQAGEKFNDPGEFIKEVRRRVANTSLLMPSSMRFPCSARIQKQLNSMKEDFDNTLAGRFLDP